MEFALPTQMYWVWSNLPHRRKYKLGKLKHSILFHFPLEKGGMVICGGLPWALCGLAHNLPFSGPQPFKGNYRGRWGNLSQQWNRDTTAWTNITPHGSWALSCCQVWCKEQRKLPGQMQKMGRPLRDYFNSRTLVWRELAMYSQANRGLPVQVY